LPPSLILEYIAPPLFPLHPFIVTPLNSISPPLINPYIPPPLPSLMQLSNVFNPLNELIILILLPAFNIKLIAAPFPLPLY
jgi:hypothetical protein